MGWWDDYTATLRDDDYQRWRLRRRLMRLGLVILTLILLSPLLAVPKSVDVRSIGGFACVLISILVLLGIYRLLGWIGRGSTPSAATASRPETGEETPFASFEAGPPSAPASPVPITAWSTEPMARANEPPAPGTAPPPVAPQRASGAYVSAPLRFSRLWVEMRRGSERDLAASRGPNRHGGMFWATAPSPHDVPTVGIEAGRICPTG